MDPSKIIYVEAVGIVLLTFTVKEVEVALEIVAVDPSIYWILLPIMELDQLVPDPVTVVPD
jgi:hypothetical protein